MPYLYFLFKSSNNSTATNYLGISSEQNISVILVKRYKSVSIDLSVGRLGHDDPVIVTRESAGGVARLQLLSHRNYELEHAVRHVDDGLGERFIELQLYELGVAKLYSPLVAFLVLAVEMLVDLVAVCFEFDVAVFTDNFEVDYNDPLLFFFAELIRAFFAN